MNNSTLFSLAFEPVKFDRQERGLENTFLQGLQKDSTTLLLHPAFAQGKVYTVGNFFLLCSPGVGGIRELMLLLKL